MINGNEQKSTTSHIETVSASSNNKTTIMNGGTDASAQASASKRFILITKPRTASNVLMRVLNLNEQPTLPKDERRDYYFYDTMPAKLGWGDFEQPWTAEEKVERMPVFQNSFNNLQAYIERASEQGKDAYFKEHVTAIEFPVVTAKDGSENESLTVPMPDGERKGDRTNTNNELVLPDAFLDTLLPTFLIRHPALMFPSMVRAMRDINFSLDALAHELSLDKTRNLYDWYTARKNDASISTAVAGTQFPVVLDADDVITSPHTLVEYAKLVNMDPELLKFSWEEGQWDTKQKSPVLERMLNTLSASTGLDKSKASGASLDIDVEAVKWREEFGEELGKYVEKVVRDTMPNYTFLRDRRLCASPSVASA